MQPDAYAHDAHLQTARPTNLVELLLRREGQQSTRLHSYTSVYRHHDQVSVQIPSDRKHFLCSGSMTDDRLYAAIL